LAILIVLAEWKILPFRKLLMGEEGYAVNKFREDLAHKKETDTVKRQSSVVKNRIDQE